MVSVLCGLWPQADKAEAPTSTSVTEEDERRRFIGGVRAEQDTAIIAWRVQNREWHCLADSAKIAFFQARSSAG